MSLDDFAHCLLHSFAARTTFTSFRVVATDSIVIDVINEGVKFSDQLDLEVDSVGTLVEGAHDAPVLTMLPRSMGVMFVASEFSSYSNLVTHTNVVRIA